MTFEREREEMVFVGQGEGVEIEGFWLRRVNKKSISKVSQNYTISNVVIQISRDSNYTARPPRKRRRVKVAVGELGIDTG